MKYYIKHTNTRTHKSMIMPTPVFESKCRAEEFAEKFVRMIANAKLEVIASK